jgi:hypothetical protein
VPDAPGSTGLRERVIATAWVFKIGFARARA